MIQFNSLNQSYNDGIEPCVGSVGCKRLIIIKEKTKGAFKDVVVHSKMFRKHILAVLTSMVKTLTKKTKSKKALCFELNSIFLL